MARLVALALALVALACAARAAVIADWYSSTSFTQLRNGTLVPNPSRVLTITCTAGDTIVLNAVDTDTNLPKTITVNCTGSQHTWDLYPVDQVPIATSIYKIQVDIVSPYLSQLTADAVATKIRKLQSQSGNPLVYLNGTESIADLNDPNAVNTGNRRRRDVPTEPPEWMPPRGRRDWVSTMKTAPTLTDTNDGTIEMRALLYPPVPYSINQGGRWAQMYGGTYDIAAFPNNCGGPNGQNTSSDPLGINFSNQYMRFCYTYANVHQCFPCNNFGTQIQIDCAALSRIERSGVNGIVAASSMSDQLGYPAVALCEQVNKLGTLVDTDYQGTVQGKFGGNYNNASSYYAPLDSTYAACNTYFGNDGVNGLHDCENTIIQVQIQFSKALQAMLDALQTTNQRIDALASQLDNLYAREEQTELLVKQQAIDFQVSRSRAGARALRVLTFGGVPP